MSKLFISYRRHDSADATGRLYDRLKSHFGHEAVFIDVDGIPFGVDFRKYLSDEVSRCDVLLAIIGDHWLAASKRAAEERVLAATILADYAGDQPEALAGLSVDADERQYALLLPRLKEQREQLRVLLRQELARKPLPKWMDDAKDTLAKRQANAAATLLHLDEAEEVWPLLRHSKDPRRRTFLIHRLAPLDVRPRLLIRRLEQEKRDSIRRALLLSLGEYADGQWSKGERSAVVPALLRLYRDDPDAGMHGALDWLLRRWGRQKALAGIDRQLAGPKARGGRSWYVNRQLQTLTVVRGPRTFLMGSPASEPGHYTDEMPHRRRIPRFYAIAAKAVTVAQFDKFRQAHRDIGHSYTPSYSPDPAGPIISVAWYQAAMYCQWLSETEQIAKDQWCYPPVAEMKVLVKAGKPIPLPADYLQRRGYRLPTEAEWEWACRAGAMTSRSYGSTEELLAKYAWHLGNSPERAQPVGRLKPNDLGLFDMHGNVWQWCQDRYQGYPGPAGGKTIEDKEDILTSIEGQGRVLRGAAFTCLAGFVRSAYRTERAPADRHFSVGLRVARTYR